MVSVVEIVTIWFGVHTSNLGTWTLGVESGTACLLVTCSMHNRLTVCIHSDGKIGHPLQTAAFIRPDERPLTFGSLGVWNLGGLAYGSFPKKIDYRPQIVGPFFEGPPEKGPKMYRHSRMTMGPLLRRELRPTPLESTSAPASHLSVPTPV